MSLQKLTLALLVFAAGETGLIGQFAQTNNFGGTNLPIPDDDLDGVQDVRSVVSDITQITSVRVWLKVSGNFNGDLYVYLRHNDGISSHIAVLLNRPGRSTTNNYGYADSGFDVVFDDTTANDIHTYHQVANPPAGAPLTGTWQPDARFVDPLIATSDFPRSAFLSDFEGMSAGGQWTLFLADVDEGGTNFLDSWGLQITGRANPSIIWTNPPAIIYGTALGPDQLNATADAPGTFVYNPPAGTVFTVSNNQLISVTFQPDDTNAYVVTSATVSMTVFPASLTVSANNQSRIYGATNPPLTGTLMGLQNGDPIVAVFQTTADTNSPVSAYSITPTLQDPAGVLGNYSINYVGGTLLVGPALLGVSADNQNRVYGGTNPMFTATYSGFVNGESLTNSDVAGAPLLGTLADTNSPVGMYDITNSVGSLTSTNYTFTFTNGTLTVAAAAITVTADNQSRPYGTSNPPLTASYTGFINGDTAAVIIGAPLLSVGAETNSPVGFYTITVDTGSLIATTNYAFTLVNGTLSVTPASLIVSADNQSRTYGATNPIFTATYSGFVNGENLANSDVAGAPLLGTLTDTNSPVGMYDITNSVGSLTSTNYTFTFTNGTLTVTAAAITVIADNQSRPYGTTNPPLTGILTGVQNGDPITAVFQTQAGPNSPAGTYPITSSLQNPDGVLGNYIVTYMDGIFGITQAVSEITLVSSANPTLPGSSVTFSANVATLVSESGTPSGRVQFIVDGADYETPVDLAGGSIASLTIATLPVGGHTVSAAYSGDANFLGATATLQPTQAIDTPPVAGADVIYRLPTLVAMMPVSALLANDLAADGNPVIFDSVGAASAAGGTVSQSGGWVFYTPLAGFTNNDSFTYVLSDDLGESATGIVMVDVLTNRGTAAILSLLSLGNGTFQIVLSGIPWGNYTIQYAESLAHPNWQAITTRTADFEGIIELQDSESQLIQTGFFRALCNSNEPASPPTSLATLTSPISLPFGLVALNSSANPALPGSSVTFSVKVAALAPASDPPSGSVQFKVDGATYGTPVSLAQSNADFTTTTLAPGNHTVSAIYSGDGSVMILNQVINTPPVAEEATVQIDPMGAGMKFQLSDLDYFDADGDPLILTISPNSAEGGKITVAQGWAFYTPPARYSGADSFNYTVQDSFGATAVSTVQIVPSVGSGGESSANLTVVDLSNGTYLVSFSGIPWLTYTLQYTESLEQPDWQSITNLTADSQGFFKYVDILPQGTQSRFYRSISESAAVTTSPFRLAVWTNFIAHTNGQTMNMWSEEIYPPGWPNTPPLLAWNTNCLLYGLDGFTGISQCNEFQGAPGQIPVTLLTRRHGYMRGHSMGQNGLQPTRAGERVWFCAADNTVVQMTVAAFFVRLDLGLSTDNDYSIVVFTKDVPDNIRPVSVISPADMEIYYSDTPDLPYLFLATEQFGFCAANVPPYIYNIHEGGDSGSPNMIPSPDNKLVMFSGTGTTGFNAQMQADMDTLSAYEGLNPTNYQLHWYDLSRWEP